MRTSLQTFAIALLLAARASSQTPPAPSFDVASIKLSDGHDPMGTGMYTYAGGRMKITGFSLGMLIREAWDVEVYRVTGGPVWLWEDRFNIDAQPPASSESAAFHPSSFKSPPTSEMRLMLQNLLIERFGIALHTAKKESNGYALVLTGKTAKLSETKNHDAFKVLGGGVSDNPEKPFFIFAENASMDLVAKRLADRFGAPVINQTSLPGEFDFRFDYPREETQEGSISAISMAMQRELGLKLMPTKATVDILIVDSAKKPSAN